MCVSNRKASYLGAGWTHDGMKLNMSGLPLLSQLLHDLQQAMEADKSIPVRPQSRGGPARRRFSRARAPIACLGISAVVLLGCSSPEAPRAVAVPPDAPTTRDDKDGGASRDAAADAQVPSGTAGGPSVHGPAPAWPPSEQTLDLTFGAAPAEATLTLVPDPSRLDVHFNVDTTASFAAEIDTIQYELTLSIIPRLRTRVADTQLGVSRFADFPLLPFGRPASRGNPDVPYQLLSPITNSLAQVKSAVKGLDRPLGEGGDIAEAAAEALYQIATGAGLTVDGRTMIEPFDRDAAAAMSGGTLGGVGFREGAFRVVVHITDAPSHTPQEYSELNLDNTHALQDAATALRAVGARVVGICTSGQNNPVYAQVRSELSELALSTGAYAQPKNESCRTGVSGAEVPSYRGVCPWVFDVDYDGSGLAQSITDAVVGLLDEARFGAVHAEVGDDPLGFIESISPSPVPQRSGVSMPELVDRLPLGAPDGDLDSYVDVSNRHKLGFAVRLRNTRIASTDFDQMFRVSVRLVGDGVVLEERLLGVRVPAAAPPAAADDRDAGESP